MWRIFGTIHFSPSRPPASPLPPVLSLGGLLCAAPTSTPSIHSSMMRSPSNAQLLWQGLKDDAGLDFMSPCSIYA